MGFWEEIIERLKKTRAEKIRKWILQQMSFQRIKNRQKEMSDIIMGFADQGWVLWPPILRMWLPKGTIACAHWAGLWIIYNNRYLGVLDQKFLEEITLKHELTHCMLSQHSVFTAFKEPYYYRFHEAMAYYFGGDPPFYGYMEALDDEMPNAPERIFKRIVKFPIGKYTTFQKKNITCKEVVGLAWPKTRKKYIAKAEKVLEKPYPKEHLFGSSIRLEDYEEWKRKKEKEAEKKK